MNIGKSIKHYLVHQDKTRTQLADHLGLSVNHVSTLCNSKTAGKLHIGELSAFFNIPVSEFIRAGE
jgi:transcriptional regulator with XRE-family HTH domain